MKKPSQGQFQLVFSYVGYKTKVIPLPPFTTPVFDLGKITLAPVYTQLEEVQVTAVKPLIEQSVDKTTYNVEADPEQNLLSAFEVMRKVPFLSIDADDNILLNGMGSYQVLVNGKRSSLISSDPSEVLKGLPASSIKQIEVITTPSARYEAAGASGIINIITYKKGITGYNGSLNLNAYSPDGYNGSTSLTGAVGKFSLSGRYSNNYSSNPSSKRTFHRLDKIQGNLLQQNGEGRSEGRSNNSGGELTYTLSPYDLITASVSINKSKGLNSYTQDVNLYNSEEELREAFKNINTTNTNGKGHDFSLNYQRSFSKNDQRQLSLLFNLINTGNGGSSDFMLQPLLNYVGRESNTSNNDETKEYNLQADYTQPIGKQALEVGIKSIFEENSSEFTLGTRNPETGDFILDPNQSDSFRYRQATHAAYLSFNFKFGKWGLRTGARLEETILNADFSTSGTQTKQQYRNLFPNIILSRLLKANSTLKLSYSQRIARPGLYYLNPYIDVTDPLNISYGNPELVPATTHAFHIEYGWYIKGISVNTALLHQFTNNTIQQYTILGEDSVSRTTFDNIGENRNYGLSLNGNATLFRNLSINLGGSSQYITFSSLINGDQKQREGFTYNMQSSATYRLGKWRASGNLSYNSPNVLLQGKTGGYTWSSLSLSKGFFKNEKARIAFSVRSPFQKYRKSLSEIEGTTFYQLGESYSVIRQYSISFSYRFGKLN